MLNYRSIKSFSIAVLFLNTLFSPIAMANEIEQVKYSAPIMSIESFTGESSINDKLEKYKQNRKDPEYYTQRNLIPFGAGSRELGDDSAVFVISVIDSTALLALGGVAFNAFSYPNNKNSTGWEIIGMLSLLGISGYAYIFGRLIGISSAYEYTNLHNEKLRKELGLTQEEIKRVNKDEQISPLISYTIEF